MLEPALLWFVLFGLFSPGPNVILLTASGARFGFFRTTPHIMGVVAGVGFVAGAVGFGIGSMLTAVPALSFALKFIASIWILRMAWTLWWSSPVVASGQDRPFTFIEAVLFQWVNPKLWAVALSASAFALELAPVQQALTLGLTFSLLNLGVCVFWSLAGTWLRGVLRNPSEWRIFMRILASLLAVFSLAVFL